MKKLREAINGVHDVRACSFIVKSCDQCQSTSIYGCEYLIYGAFYYTAIEIPKQSSSPRSIDHYKRQFLS